MKKKPFWFYEQSGAIPFQIKNGRLRILLITSRNGSKWIIPKGIVAHNYSPAGSAAKETWEEAGIKGRTTIRGLGQYKYKKWGGTCTVEVFPLKVEEIRETWPEQTERKRKWFSPADAVEKLKNSELRGFVLRLAELHEGGALEKLLSSTQNNIEREEHLQMKRLILTRHAKSSWDNRNISDFDRPLNKRGKLAAPIMGQRLAEKDIEPDAIITSPAKRAKKTACLIAEEINFDKEAIEVDESIYEAGLPDLLALVRGLDDSLHEAMLVGHNPGFTELGDFLADQPIDHMPTCGILCMDFPIESWSEITEGAGKLIFFDYPKK